MPDTAVISATSVIHASFVIERRYPASAERVFAAFADPAKKRRWFADERHIPVESFEMDFRVGGHDRAVYRMSDSTPFPGAAMTNDTVYQDIVPGRRIVFAYTMSIAERRISASLVTVELSPDGAGARMLFTEQAAFFDGSDGPKMRQEGWEGLLANLETALAG